MFDKKYFLLTMAVPAAVVALNNAVLAETYMSDEEAIKFALGTSDMKSDKKTVAADQLKAIGSANKVSFDSKKTEFTFYRGGGAYALIDSSPGKHGAINYVIAITPDGKVKNIAITEFSDRPKQCTERKFLDQFIGKTLESELKFGKAMEGVAGGTISAMAVLNGVKKSLALFKHCYPPPQVITKEDVAVKNILPKGAKPKQASVTITGKELEPLKKQYEDKIQLADGEQLSFYSGADEKAGGPEVFAVIYQAEGENGGIIKYMVGLSSEGLITGCPVLTISDAKDKPLASGAFLDQFKGKGISDLVKLDLEKDVKIPSKLNKAANNFVQGLRNVVAAFPAIKENK